MVNMELINESSCLISFMVPYKLSQQVMADLKVGEDSAVSNEKSEMKLQ